MRIAGELAGRSRTAAMRIAVLTCARLPGAVTADIPDANALFSDDRMLVAELVRRGVQAESIVWSDPSVDWDGFDTAVLRSTWDYIDDRERFLDRLEAIEASSCTLLNSLEIVRWNTDKSYLFDLAALQIPVVPTLRAADGSAEEVQAEVVRRGWSTAVMKPAIGAGGAGVQLVEPTDVAATIGSLAVQQPDARYLLQPLVESVRTEGEYGYVFIGGELTHVLLKRPATGDYRTHGIYGGSLEVVQPNPDDRRQAEAIVARLPFRPLYARADLVRVDGRLAVMELELVEPMLYLELAPHAAEKLATATIAALQDVPRAPAPDGAR